MAWNEPGGSNNDDKDKEKNQQDPWGGPPKNKGGNQGPPDLDEVFRKLKGFFGKILGEDKPSNNNYPNHHRSGRNFSIFPIVLIFFVIMAGFWLSKAIYVVDQQEKAIILRFGKFYSEVGPGLHIYFPPIDSKQQVNVTAERSYTKHGQMLTKDENIVEIPLTVQYRITNLEKFLLQNADPEKTLENATDSALRQVAGSTTMDQILTSGRSEMSTNIQNTLEDLLEKYDTGIKITQVNIQSATAPADVQRAFDDVIRAREDQQRSQNKAETYHNAVVPTARGEAARLQRQAEAYQQEAIEKAKGQTARFEALLSAYEKAPTVTRERMYLEALEEVLSNTSKVLVTASDAKNQLLYLPIDKMMNNTPRSELRQETRTSADSLNDNSSMIEQTNPQSPPIDNARARSRFTRGAR